MGNSWARRCGAVAITVAGAIATVTPTSAAAEVVWTAAALEVPSGVFSVRVNGTDGADQSVGSFDSFNSGQVRPGVIWRGTALTVLGEAFDDLTDLVAINTSGVAVGSHAGVGENPQATRWVGDHYEDLPAPAGSRSTATSVNERGDIVGTADGQVILWPASDPSTYQLLAMPFPTSATGVSIDDAGTVVAGVLEPVGSGPSRAFRWDSTGQPRELQRVRQDVEHGVLTINNGRIAGSTSPQGGVIWNSRGHVRRVIPDVLMYGMNASGDLLARGVSGGPWFVEENGCRTSLPDNFLPSGATTLTDDGAVAGYSFDSTTFQQTAVLWRRG
jgi:hypothetical protein